MLSLSILFQSRLYTVTEKHDWEAYCLCVCAGNFAMVGIWGGCSINTLCARGESRLHKHADMPTYSPATTHTASQRKDTQPWQADSPHTLNETALYITLSINTSFSWIDKMLGIKDTHGMFTDNQMHQTSQTQSVCNSHSDHWQQRCRSCGTLSFVIRVWRPRQGVSPTPKSLWHDSSMALTLMGTRAHHGVSSSILFFLQIEYAASLKYKPKQWKSSSFHFCNTKVHNRDQFFKIYIFSGNEWAFCNKNRPSNSWFQSCHGICWQ